MTAMSSAQEEVYISVDVETAGPIPATYSLLSLGAAVVGNPMQHFYAEFQPITENIVPEALAVSGFSLTTLAQQGEVPEAAMRRFRDWIIKICDGRTPVFVGFNAGFDWAFVNWYFHTYLGENPFGFSALDIKAYYMGLAGCRWNETTSRKLLPTFQPTETIANHNALTDAQAQAEIFAKLLSAPRMKEE
jgi:DNA polymerase III epsilon subunit-like protein